MRYIFPTTTNVCSYTTLAKNELSYFHVFNNRYTGFISTKLFFVLDPDAARLCCHCQVLSVLQTLVFFNFLNFMLTM